MSRGVFVKGVNMVNFKVVSLAVNLPGPAAARRFKQFGARVFKVEPPGGDMMHHACPEYYQELNRGQEVISLDLKAGADKDALFSLLEDADLLLTASRPDALERLGLGWDVLHGRFPQLCMVAIVGYPSPDENLPGHDLTYQAKQGLLLPPQLPRTLVADLAGAERAVSEALALLLARELGQGSGLSKVPLSEVTDFMAEPLQYGLTAPTGPLGGTLAEYNNYQANDGWVAVAALEPHFRKRLAESLGLEFKGPEDLRPLFAEKSVGEWVSWAAKHDLPIVAIKE